MTGEGRRGAATRRTFLGAVGVVAGTGTLPTRARATNRTPLSLTLHVHEDCTPGDVRCAADAAATFADQFRDRFDEYALSWTFDAPSAWPTERDVLERRWRRHVDDDGHGIHAFLLREPWQTDDGYGHRMAPVTGDGGAAVANVGATRFWDGDRVATNILIHEVLHALGADHADGTATLAADGNDRVYADVSPMATAYVRYVAPECDTPLTDACADTVWPGSGTVPEQFSDGTENYARAAAVANHSHAVAEAAWESAADRLDELD